jgi:hypothetical protein
VNELLRLDGNLRREGLRTCSHVVKLRIAVQLNNEYVSPKSVRAREGARCWRKQGNELLRLDGNPRREALRTCSHLLIAVQLNSEYVSQSL